MKKVIIILITIIININTLYATTGLLKSATIIECDGELYGKHGSDNHYHKAEETEKGKYKAVGDSLGTKWTCEGTIKNINENKTLEQETVEF